MIKYILIIGIFFSSIQLFGQSNICQVDKTVIGQLINTLTVDGKSSVTIQRPDSKKKLSGTRLCEYRHKVTIDSLTKLLTNKEVDDLIHCENGNLTVIGFIIFCNRTNEKSEILKKLEVISKGQYRIIATNCSDAIQIYPVGQYCMKILEKRDGLIKRTIELTKDETEKLNEEIKASEMRYWDE